MALRSLWRMTTEAVGAVRRCHRGGFQTLPVRCMENAPKVPSNTLYPRDNRLCPRNQAGGFETLPYDLGIAL